MHNLISAYLKVKTMKSRTMDLSFCKRLPVSMFLILFSTVACMDGAYLAVAQKAPDVSSVQSTQIAGPHPVGLKVVNQFDFSRSYRFSTDELGQPYKGERARPLQTLIWYPAQKTGEKPMTVGDYVHLIATNARYDKPSAENEEASSRKEMENILSNLLWAVRDAPQETGKFPLVIYSPGMDDESWDNASLCEYLLVMVML